MARLAAENPVPHRAATPFHLAGAHAEGAVLNPDPEKFYTLPDAFDVLGREFYHDTWTGAEIAARNLPPPKATFQVLKEAKERLDRERRAKVERAKKAATGVWSGARTSSRPYGRPAQPEVIERERIQEIARYAGLEPETVTAASNQRTYRSEYKARVRRDKAENELRKLLHGKHIPATLLNNHDGKLVDIPPAHWLADKFTVNFAFGQAEWTDLEEGQRIAYQGFVLIDRPKFVQVVMGTQPLESKPSKIRHRLGRKKGSGSLAALDKPLLEEMEKMISEGSVVSEWAAALKMAPKATGSGTIESKARRLARHYREQQN